MRYFLPAFLALILAIANPVTMAPAMAESGRVCLEPVHGNTFSHWQNHCPFRVHVNWSDGASCKNYGCASTVGPNERSTATISRKTDTEWCEFHNTNTGSCKTAANSKAPTASGNAGAGGGAVQFGGGGGAAAITAEQRTAYGSCAGDAETEATFDAIYADIGAMTGGRDIAGFQRAVEFIVYGIGARDPAKWARYEALVNRCR